MAALERFKAMKTIKAKTSTPATPVAVAGNASPAAEQPTSRRRASAYLSSKGAGLLARG